MAAASFNQMRVQTHCQSRLRRRAADKTVWGRERYRLQTLLPSIGQLCDRMWAARGRTVANCRPMPRKEMKSQNWLGTLLVPRPLESRLHSNAQVRKRLLSRLAGYSWSGVAD